MSGPDILPIEEVKLSDPSLLGAKGDRLAVLHRAGFPIAKGFCVTTCAHLAYLKANGLGPDDDVERRRAVLAQAVYPAGLEQAIIAAYRRLGAGPVAVRSSAVEEDLPAASFAGQQDTFLDVCGERELLAAISRCWASLWSDRAVAYRREHGRTPGEPQMAVVIQTMVHCDVSGVAFSVDPVIGADSVVIEAAGGAGLVVGGAVDVQRYTIDRSSRRIHVSAQKPFLTEEQVRQLAGTALALESLFGEAQDVEWGFAAHQLYLFQSRPVTTKAHSFFTDVIPDDKHLWTSGFLNERFPRPVSPLGWTLIRELLEPLAFRDPLRFMGYRLPQGIPVTRLYRGYPFVNVRVFQILYKPFPGWMLPEDAARYFPHGDTGQRRSAEYPCCSVDPRFLVSMLRSFLQDPANASPLHNYRHWTAFLRQCDAGIEDFRRRLAALGERTELAEAWSLCEDMQTLNARLLAIHRWSLTYADIFYSLLRRSLAAWLGERGPALCAQLVVGLPNKSVELNLALQNLRSDGDLQAFNEAYGHRSFSLDIYHPTFAEDPGQIRFLAGRVSTRLDPAARASEREAAILEARQSLMGQSWGWIKARAVKWMLFYAHRYMPLREEQRFYWQKILALQRQLCLWVGRRLAEQGWLERPDDICFATLEEVREAAKGSGLPSAQIVRRRTEFAGLLQLCEREPGLACPNFLRGNEPLPAVSGTEANTLRGLAVSPGAARGPARVIASPGQFERISPGDILVTRGADPGWTPIFARIAGLVTEVGGQLSHGAVVAREYGLPAVAGIQGAMQLIRDGQEIVVDGLAGTVILGNPWPPELRVTSRGGLAVTPSALQLNRRQ